MVHAPSVDGLGVHQEFELAAGKNVEELPVILAGLQLLAVHREDEVAGRDLDVIVIGRALAVDVADLVEAAGIGLQVEAGIAGGDALLGRPLRGQAAAAGDAGVRGVHLADHFHDQVVQLFGIGDVRQHGLVLVLGRGPVDAVHFGIVEAVLHHAPGFFENLAALGGDIDLHPHGEVDAPRGRAGRMPVSVAGAAAVAPPRPPRPPRPPAAAAARGIRRGRSGRRRASRCRRPAGNRCCGCRASIAARCRHRIRRVRRVRDRAAPASATVVFRRVRREPSSSMVYMPGPPPAPVASSVAAALRGEQIGAAIGRRAPRTTTEPGMRVSCVMRRSRPSQSIFTCTVAAPAPAPRAASATSGAGFAGGGHGLLFGVDVAVSGSFSIGSERRCRAGSRCGSARPWPARPTPPISSSFLPSGVHLRAAR